MKDSLPEKKHSQPEIAQLAFNVTEAAQALRVSNETVYNLLRRGLLKSSSAFRHKIIPVTEVQRFLTDTLK